MTLLLCCLVNDYLFALVVLHLLCWCLVGLAGCCLVDFGLIGIFGDGLDEFCVSGIVVLGCFGLHYNCVYGL